MPRQAYHRAFLRPNRAAAPAKGLADGLAKQNGSAPIDFAKLKSGLGWKAALAAIFLLPGAAFAQDNTAAYQALSRASMPHARFGEAKKTPQDAKLHKVAKEFEGVFLTEMLRLARPPDKAASGFSAGESGGTWQVFMDQALGKAAAENGGTGLGKQIEDALRGKHGKHTVGEHTAGVHNMDEHTVAQHEVMR